MTRRVLICLSLFLLAFAVRTLTWQDNKRDAWKVQTYVTSGYKDSAHQLARGDFKAFVSDVNHLGHPPGYPILLAVLFQTVGDSDTALQFIQITADSVAVVVLFLISLELLQLGVALIAGLLAAISPQFAYFSVLLLPDSLIVLPILLAIYLIVRSRNQTKVWGFMVAGILIGLSCWLRANALLLAPFIALLIPLLVAKGKRLSCGAAIVTGAVLAIAPITIKNAIVFHSFIPVSLGSGQTLLEGIADYDEKGRFNIPITDLGIMRQEAQWYGKPEYAQLLFGEDGIARDRMRVARGFAVIRSNPIWFTGVMAQRAIASTRLDPVPVLLPESPVSHPLGDQNAKLAWTKPASLLIGPESQRSQNATITLISNDSVKVRGDETNYGDQLITETISVHPFYDYVFKVPFKLEEGRSLIKITGADKTRVLASSGVDFVEGVPAAEQPVNELEIPFVSAGNSQVRIAISNYAAANSTFVLGSASMQELGPSSMSWLRYIRIPLRLLQRVFTTAWVLPFTVIGIVLLIRRRSWQELAILLAVPLYYLIVQSALHTERRYVYIIHFFFIVLSGVTLCWLGGSVMAGVRKLRGHQ